MKPMTDAHYAFKAAVRRAVKMAGGPNAATDVVRVDAPRLSRYGNIDAPEFAPIDVCFELVGLIRMHWRGFSGGEEVWRSQRDYGRDK